MLFRSTLAQPELNATTRALTTQHLLSAAMSLMQSGGNSFVGDTESISSWATRVRPSEAPRGSDTPSGAKPSGTEGVSSVPTGNQRTEKPLSDSPKLEESNSIDTIQKAPQSSLDLGSDDSASAVKWLVPEADTPRWLQAADGKLSQAEPRSGIFASLTNVAAKLQIGRAHV